MKKYLSFLICCLIAFFAMAQKPATSNVIADLIPAGVEVTITHNSVTVDGKKIEYTAVKSEDPKVLISQIKDLEHKIIQGLDEVEKMI